MSDRDSEIGDRLGDLRISDEASADRLAGLRHELTGWATRAGLAPDRVQEIALCTYEALVNAVEHGYGGRPGQVDLHATRTGDTVTITVADRGRWRTPPEDPGVRGRGLILIRGLSARAEISGTAQGTTVSMVWRLDD